jgi:beta-lactamase superfamily II metal-dependent hydrolase
VPTTLHQLELDQTDVNCGMSYVIQLRDGRYVIIDGGYFTPGEDDRLYRFLVDRSEGMPVIANWFFTHAHQDHIGAFMLFARKYLQSVDLQRLTYNFHPADLSQARGDWRQKSNDLATLKEFYRTIDTCCSHIQTITPRTGDTFQFEELHMEVIFTYEDLYADRGDIPTNSTAIRNDHSVVVRTTVEGYTTLWLADAGAKACPILLQNPDKLVCDMVQVAHHGIDNHQAMLEVYAATGAQVVLWPACDYGMAERAARDVNRFILQKMNVKEHHVSGYGTSSLPLPYRPGTAVKRPKSLGLPLAVGDPTAWPMDGGDSTALRYVTQAAVPADPRP